MSRHAPIRPPVVPSQKQLHLIPSEEEGPVTSAPTNLVSVFDASSVKMRDLCANVVQQEAVKVRKRLVDIQESRKRQRTTTADAPSPKTVSPPRESPENQNVPEELAVRRQADRMMRMATLLRQYEATVAQLRHELADYEDGLESVRA